MNFSDSEIVGSIMTDSGFETTTEPETADVIFINTCSIRDHAEQRVRRRLQELKSLKKKNPGLIVGILGCMAERLKEHLIEEEEFVDMIVGPDAYRDLPSLMNSAENGQKAINVLLSAEETYADIPPVRLNSNKVTAFISIMRGCENYCAYCVVPYTRGRERSRSPETIIQEARNLFMNGYREVTLLGQNVNSYLWKTKNETINFPGLIEKVARVNPGLRVRFATSHPKDLSDELLHTIKKYTNICRSIHLPVQSGSNKILKLMNRKYTVEWYMERINAIREILPDCSITTDIITGFCEETETDHQDTLSLMKQVKYDYAYMFKYSERPGTPAEKKYEDNVPELIKSKRLNEIIEIQQELSLESNQKDIGKTFEVLVEGTSRKSDSHLAGRNSQNKVIVFPAYQLKPGDYVRVTINKCTSATLIGDVINN